MTNLFFGCILVLVNAPRLISRPDQLSALLNQERLDLLSHLREPNSASSLARLTGKPRQQINYHLRELERRGFLKHIEDRRKGNCVERVLVRSTDTIYISPDVLGPLAPKPEILPDKFSATYLFHLAANLMRDLSKSLTSAAAKNRSIPALAQAGEIRFSSPESSAAFAQELATTLATLTAKYHDDDAPRTHEFKWMFGAYPA